MAIVARRAAARCRVSAHISCNQVAAWALRFVRPTPTTAYRYPGKVDKKKFFTDVAFLCQMRRVARYGSNHNTVSALKMDLLDSTPVKLGLAVAAAGAYPNTLISTLNFDRRDQYLGRTSCCTSPAATALEATISSVCSCLCDVLPPRRKERNRTVVKTVAVLVSEPGQRQQQQAEEGQGRQASQQPRCGGTRTSARAGASQSRSLSQLSGGVAGLLVLLHDLSQGVVARASVIVSPCHVLRI